MSNGGKQGDGRINMENCVCEICDHDLGFRCGMQNDCYGNVEDINDCEDYWDGDCYVCETCGWCGK